MLSVLCELLRAVSIEAVLRAAHEVRPAAAAGAAAVALLPLRVPSLPGRSPRGWPQPCARLMHAVVGSTAAE